MLLNISQVSVTTTSTTPYVTVVWSSASPFTMTITVASTSVGLTTFGQHDVVLPPELIPRDTMWDSVGLTIEPQQQQQQSQMFSQAYANYVMGPLQVSFLFQS